MPSTTAVYGMLRTDSLRIRRDRFLLGISSYLLVVFVMMRAVIPWLTKEIVRHWEFDLTPYHPLLVSYFVVQLGPLLPGIVGGFLLLESREEGTVKALLVSPNPLTSYVLVASFVMCVTAVTLTLAEAAIIGIALPSWPALIAVGLVAAPAAPIFALLIAAISDNKVQAFAYMKLFGLGPPLVIAAYFLPEPWQWLTAIYPPYCASKAYWLAEAGDGSWPLWILAGLVCSGVWVVMLQGLYLRAARK